MFSIIEQKNKFYIGQSVNVYKRVCQHFDVEGNQQLYQDVKTDDAAVGTILLKNTNYPYYTKEQIKKSLDELEQKMIFKYHFTTIEYNKKRH